MLVYLFLCFNLNQAISRISLRVCATTATVFGWSVINVRQLLVLLPSGYGSSAMVQRHGTAPRLHSMDTFMHRF